MALILLTQYADERKISRDTVFRRVKRGRYETAQKIGRDWWIDSEEEFNDQRFNPDKVKVEVVHE